MNRLNKRFEKSLKSVRAQATCPCSKTACNGCISGDVTSNTSSTNTQYKIHKTGQTALWT